VTKRVKNTVVITLVSRRKSAVCNRCSSK